MSGAACLLPGSKEQEIQGEGCMTYFTDGDFERLIIRGLREKSNTAHTVFLG